jgi:E3 ubiquitin-protein ligase HUWE1
MRDRPIELDQDSSTQGITNKPQLVEQGYDIDGDRQLIESILDFSRVLLENCGNRSLYASSSYLDSLLNTTSLPLLLSTLRLTVRLAQRYNASRQRTIGTSQHMNHALLAMHYAIDLEKINKLASPFIKSSQSSEPLSLSTQLTPTAKSGEVLVPGTPTPIQSTDLVAFSDGQAAQESKTEWQEWGDVYMHYYSEEPIVSKEESKKSQSTATTSSSSLPNGSTPTSTRRESSRNYSTPTTSRLATSDDLPASPSTPDQVQKNSEEQISKMKHVSITSSQVSNTPLTEILNRNLPKIPPESQYDLLQRLRVAAALSKSEETRQQIVAIRILALTNLTYVYSEPHLQYKILQQDTDEPRRLQLAYQFADLVHPQKNKARPVPRWLQTIALGGLEALAKQKSRATDVCGALSVNVNHGILLYILRKAIEDLNKADEPEKDIEEDEWREALFSLLMYLPSISRTGEALLSAGLLPILMDGLTYRTVKAERCFPKVLSFLDTFVYNVRDAFQTLANVRGLDIIAELTAYEVESAHGRAERGEGMPLEFRNKMIDYQIPYHQQQTLRWLFKFMNHMLSHPGGAFDRLLRNLIDSPPLLKGLRIVLSNAPAFGSNVWSGAVNILSSFIHNEPTSYAVIAEAGLSKAFLEAVTGSEIVVPEEKDGNEDSTLLSVGLSEAMTARMKDLLNGGLEAAADDIAYLGISPRSTISDTSKPRSKSTPLAQGILPATDAIATVPGAFGAICLNAAGRSLLQASNALESFFEVFESPEHVRCMDTESELPQILGNSFDELVRHHPELKLKVMYSVMLMIARVGQRCRTKARTRGAGTKLWYGDAKGQPAVCGGWPSLIGKQGSVSPKSQQATTEATKVEEENQDEDVEMADAQEPTANGSANGPSSSQDASLDQRTPQIPPAIEEPAEAQSADKIATHDSTEPVRAADIPSSEDPIVSVYLDVVGKFLSGFFSNTTLASGFIDLGGFDYIIDLVTLPSLPYDYNNQSASRSLAGVIHMLVEQKPHLVLPTLVKRTQAAVDGLKPFIEHTKETAYFRTLTNSRNTESGNFDSDLSIEHDGLIKEGTDLAKAFVNVHTLSNVLYETFSHSLYNHRSSYTLLNQVNLSDYYAKLVKSLGRLHARCVWEEILLQNSIPESWKEATRFHGFGLGGEEANDILGLLPMGVDATNEVDEWLADESITHVPVEGLVTSTGAAALKSKPNSVHDRRSSEFMCVRTLRYLLSQLPATITPLFAALGKGLVAKRQPDSQQKQNASLVAEAMAEAMLDQLKREDMDEPIEEDKKQDQYSYWILMLTSTSQCLVDGKNLAPIS